MNMEIGAEAAQFPEKEYINGTAVAVYRSVHLCKQKHNKSHETVPLKICEETPLMTLTVRAPKADEAQAIEALK
jgi:hypothetical protein